MLTAVTSCFAKYLTFSGRAARPEYWYFALFLFLALFTLSILDFVLFGSDPETGEPAALLAPLFQLATLVPLLAVGWRRMHDSGRPGWYLLVPLALSVVISLFLLLGVVGFAAMDASGAPRETLQAEAGVLGSTGLLVGMVGQVVSIALVLWWTTRPSDPGPNDYGPAPPR